MWEELEAARMDLGVRARGDGLTQAEMARLLNVPLSTYTDWRPSGKVGEVPRAVRGHLHTLQLLPSSKLRAKVKGALARSDRAA